MIQGEIMEYVIESTNLVKRYGNKAAVNNLSLHVRRGDIYGLIGKNGAGKTSLMKLFLGLTTPNSGSMKLLGTSDLNSARAKIGSLIEEPALYNRATAYENLKRLSILVPSSDEKIYEALRTVGLSDVGNKKVGAFSLGMRQRLGLALALLGEPEIMILDEPINGLDPAGIKEIRDIILDLNSKGVTFLISSHLLDELGKVATNFGIMSDGSLVEEITAQDLAELTRAYLKIVTDNAEEAAKVIAGSYPSLRIETVGNEVHIKDDAADSSEINRALVSSGVRVFELRNENRALEDFFIERMGM